MGDDYERVICVKPEVFVYKIPPRQSSRGYRAADWKLEEPDWTGRLRIIVLNNNCIIKLEDKTSGELFAQAHVRKYPGSSVESVSDSSRYFVLKIQDESGRHAFIGIGFTDRGDSFDFNVSLQDHFKREKVEDEITKTSDKNETPLDLSFKDGQTIKINFGNKTGQESRPKTKQEAAGSIGLLPPPPSSGAPKLVPPPSSGMPHHPVLQQQPQQHPTQQQPQKPQQSAPQSTDWGDFAAFGSSNGNSSGKSDNWVQF